MDNVKTITAREIKQIASTFYEQPKYVMWHGKRIKINPLLSFEEFVSLIDEIFKRCVDNGSGRLILETVDFVFKVEFLKKYCSIVLPENVEDQYKIIYGSDLIELCFDQVNHEQLANIKKIINAHIGSEIV